MIYNKNINIGKNLQNTELNTNKDKTNNANEKESSANNTINSSVAANDKFNKDKYISHGSWKTQEIKDAGITLPSEYFVGVYTDYYRFNFDAIARDFPYRNIQSPADLKKCIDEKKSGGNGDIYLKLGTIQNVIKALNHKNFDSVEEFNEFLNSISEYKNELVIKQVYSNGSYIYYEVSHPAMSNTATVTISNSNSAQCRGRTNNKIKIEGVDTESLLTIVNELFPDVEQDMVKSVINELAKTANSKGVDQMAYISARLVDFIEMRAENPNMSIDKMNETLALNKVFELNLSHIIPIVSELFDTEITSFEELLEFQDFELFLCDEYPQAKEAYIQTSRITYLTLAQNGELTKGEYYNLIKADLFNIFPNSDELNDADREVLLRKIDSLSPRAVEDFINSALSVQGCYYDEYDSALSKFLSKFDEAVGNGECYTQDDANELMSLSEVYSSIGGVEYNPDLIIETNYKLEKIEDAINETIIYDAASNIFNAVANGDKDVGTALWQIAVLYTGSTEVEDILNFLRKITDNENIYAEGNSVVIKTESKARTRNAAPPNNDEQSVLNAVKSWCSNAWSNTVDFCISDSVQESNAKADLSSVSGFCDYITDLISDPNFYKDFGNWCQAAALGCTVASAAVVDAPVTLPSAGILEIIGGASYSVGAVLDYVQNPDSSYNGITNFIAELMTGLTTVVGGKYIDASVQVPPAVKSAWDKVTGGVNSITGKLFGYIDHIKNSKYLDDEMEVQHLNFLKDIVKTGKYFDANILKGEEKWAEIRPWHGGTLKGIERNISPNNIRTIREALNNWKYMSSSLVDALLTRKTGSLYYKSYDLLKGATTKKEIFNKLIEEYMKQGANYEQALAAANRRMSNFDLVSDRINLLKTYLSKNTNTVPLDVTRREYEIITNTIKIGDKNLTELFKECAEKGDYTELLAILNRGDLSYTFDRMAGTSIFGGYNFGDVNWRIHLPQGTNGMFADVYRNQYSWEWEWLMAEGTKVNISHAYVDEQGRLFLEAVAEVKTKQGETIYKKVAIAIGLLTGAAAAANAQTDNPYDGTQTDSSAGNSQGVSDGGSTDNRTGKPDGSGTGEGGYNGGDSGYVEPNGDNGDYSGGDNTAGNQGANGASGSGGAGGNDGSNSAQNGENGENDVAGSDNVVIPTGTVITAGDIDCSSILKGQTTYTTNGEQKGSITYTPTSKDRQDIINGLIQAKTNELAAEYYGQNVQISVTCDNDGHLHYEVTAVTDSFTSIAGITLDDIQRKYNDILNNPAYLLASTNGYGSGDGGLGALTAFMYKLQNDGYVDENGIFDYAQCYMDMYNAGLIGDCTINKTVTTDDYGNVIAVTTITDSDGKTHVYSQSSGTNSNMFNGYPVDGNADEYRQQALALYNEGIVKTLEEAYDIISRENQLGYTGKDYIDENIRSGQYINSDGTFDVDRLMEDCLNAGISECDFSCYTRTSEDGTEFLDLEGVIGFDEIALTFAKGADGKWHIVNGFKTAPSQEILLEEGLEAIRNALGINRDIYQGAKYNISGRAKALFDYATKVAMQQYYIKAINECLTGLSGAVNLFEFLSENFGGYVGKFTASGELGSSTIKFEIQKEVISNYVLDMMDKDEAAGYNSFQQFLRWSDRLAAFEHLCDPDGLTSNEVYSAYESIKYDTCVGQYGWLSNNNDFSNGNVNTPSQGSTYIHPDTVTGVMNQQKALESLQGSILNKLDNALSGTEYYVSSMIRRSATGQPYIEVRNKSGQTFQISLTGQSKEADKIFQGEAKNILNALIDVTRGIAQLESAIKRAELEYYEAMTLLAMGQGSYEDVQDASENYMNLVRKYQSTEDGYAYVMHYGGTVDCPYGDESYWSPYGLWNRYAKYWN